MLSQVHQRPVQILGMVNQLGKFSAQISNLTEPLQALLSSKNMWVWGPEQEQAFSLIKEELVKPTVLALYDPEATTKVSADASSFSLGAVLLQQHASEWKPVASASRAMNETERRYAQIEKEALAVTKKWLLCHSVRIQLFNKYASPAIQMSNAVCIAKLKLITMNIWSENHSGILHKYLKLHK